LVFNFNKEQVLLIKEALATLFEQMEFEGYQYHKSDMDIIEELIGDINAELVERRMELTRQYEK
jgi:hypothetical protein